jgi:SAM-dependent methyltransferase
MARAPRDDARLLAPCDGGAADVTPRGGAAGRGGVPTYALATIAAYRRSAKAAMASWARGRRPSRLLRRFVQMLPPAGRVLDYGCGIGLELAWMRWRGLRVEGVDGTWEFVREARRRCPGVMIRQAVFETVRLPRGAYDGIWCQAALMHVPPAALASQLDKLRCALRPGGVLGLSLAWGRAKAFSRRDWIPGRFVAAYSLAEVRQALAGWRIRELGVASSDGCQGRWIHLLAVPEDASSGTWWISGVGARGGGRSDPAHPG